MPFATEPDLLIYYPGFADVALDAIRPVTLLDSKCYFDEMAWGCNLKLGHIHATAHMLTVWMQTQDAGVGGMAGGGASASGVVASKAKGPVSVSYSTMVTAGDDDSWWSTTRAGQEYLRRRSNVGPMMESPFGQGVVCR